jgi:hypothetical protein
LDGIVSTVSETASRHPEHFTQKGFLDLSKIHCSGWFRRLKHCREVTARKPTSPIRSRESDVPDSIQRTALNKFRRLKGETQNRSEGAQDFIWPENMRWG